MKTRPNYPNVPFASIEAAKAWTLAFIAWYNGKHRHSSIGFVTPNQRHSGQSDQLLAKRRLVYEEAKKRTPQRWSGSTRKWTAPSEVFLNPDKETLERLRN